MPLLNRVPPPHQGMTSPTLQRELEAPRRGAIIRDPTAATLTRHPQLSLDRVWLLLIIKSLAGVATAAQYAQFYGPEYSTSIIDTPIDE